MQNTAALTVVMGYAGVNGLILVWLTLIVIRHRIKVRIGLGDGGDRMLQRAIRAQSNFIEMAPYSLIVLFLLALGDTSLTTLHALALTLTASRIIHGIHFNFRGVPFIFRRIAAGMSIAVLAIGSVMLIQRAAGAFL